MIKGLPSHLPHMCSLDEFALGEQSPNFSSTGYHTPRGTCGVLDSALREAKLCVAFFVQQQVDNFASMPTRGNLRS